MLLISLTSVSRRLPVNVTQVSSFPYCDDVLDAEVSLLDLPTVADKLGISVTRVHQLLREHQLLAIKRNRVVGVPAAFFGADGNVLKQLPGLIAVLRDGGYTEGEIVRWMFTEDDSLPGMPIEALHGHLAREVLRRAQAMAF